MSAQKNYTQKVLANGEQYLSKDKDKDGKKIVRRRNYPPAGVIARYRFIKHVAL